MSMRNCCWRASRITRSIWWVQRAAIINGKPSSEMRFDVDHFLIDWEHHQATCPEGHKSLSWTRAIDTRTNEGDLEQMLHQRLSSVFQPAALHAIAAPCAPHRHHPTQGAVRGVAGQATAAKAPGTSRPCMPPVQAWKGRFRKGFAPWDYAARAPSGKSARICTMWQQRLPSMSFVSSIGWMVSLMPRPDSPLLHSYIARLLRVGQKGSPPVSRVRKNQVKVFVIPNPGNQ